MAAWRRGHDEGFGPWTVGDDEALLDIVTSANVACGFHAGDPSIMRRVSPSGGSPWRAAAPGRILRYGRGVLLVELDELDEVMGLYRALAGSAPAGVIEGGAAGRPAGR